MLDPQKIARARGPGRAQQRASGAPGAGFWTGFWAAVLCAVLLCAPQGPAQAAPRPVSVYAAASLGGALEVLARKHEAQTGQRVRIVAASSATLARQIALGAPADIFVSANREWMRYLDARGLIEPGSARALLRNRLVLIARRGAPGRAAQGAPLASAAALRAALGDGRLAMGLVDAVPAGIYAAAALRSLGLWAQIADKTLQTENVRAALRLVAAGHAPLGIVYASDAQRSERVEIRAWFDPAHHPEIVYPAARIAGAGDAGQAFFARLFSDEAAALFSAEGFLPPAARRE